MNRIYALVLLAICLLASFRSEAGNLWRRQTDPIVRPGASTPVKYLVYQLEEEALHAQVALLNDRGVGDIIITLPLADGSFRQFRVWSSSLLPPGLAAKYPGLRAYTAEAVNDHSITAKLDVNAFGFHAIIYGMDDISFIDPDTEQPGTYRVHYKKDERRDASGRSTCLITLDMANGQAVKARTGGHSEARTTNGEQLRAYRLALSCDHQYAQAATGLPNPTVAQTLSKMMTTINRVNGVYEREIAVTLNFVENEDSLIFTDSLVNVSGPDPFGTINADAGQCLITNQTVCDDIIGNANYDVGHVFTTGAGGLSQVGVACSENLKAQSVTGQPFPVGDGFDIDYVSHEIGHEFGGEHPFNNGMDGSCCCGTIVPESAYEPGSGSTIMAYAGICAPDDLQPHSDPYFHAVSLQEIQSYITNAGDECAVKTPTGNKPAGLPPFTASYSIPYLTPFELTAPVITDSVADTGNLYCWEQWNLGDVEMELINTHYAGPIFRSFLPVRSRTRVFPNDTMVLAGILSNAGTEGHEGEKAPDVARYLTFKLSVRDIYNGTGCLLIPDDTVHLDVVNTGSGFAVTSQHIPGSAFFSGSSQTVTWNVAGTNDAPISADSVIIFLSRDGGYTWSDTLGTYSNNGSASVHFPVSDSIINAARIKVKGKGNVFFNVNATGFKISPDSAAAVWDIRIFPVPADNTLYVTTGVPDILQAVIFNTVGQKIWAGSISGQVLLTVNEWARGIYFLYLGGAAGKHMVKKFAID